MTIHRVLYTSRSFEICEYGGVNRYFYEMLRAGPIAERFSVTLFAGLHLCRYPLAELRKKGIRVYGKRVPRFHGIGRLLRTANSAMERMLVPRFDLVHQTFYAARFPYVRNAIHVTTVHDMIGEIFPGRMGDPLQAALKAESVGNADGIVFDSESTRKDCFRLLPSSAAVPNKVVHLGVAPRPAHGSSLHTRPYILFVGERRGYKNFEVLRKAYATLGELGRQFDLVCFGGLPLGPDERDLTRYHGDDDVAAALYRHATCLVYPSDYEGFGLPPLEAFAYGCPVVTTNVSSMPEIVGAKATMVSPGDVGALSEALVKVLSSPVTSAQRVALEAHAAAFTWELAAYETAAFYSELLAKRKLPFR